MDTNECRSSRGVQAAPSLAALVIFWNFFLACQRSQRGAVLAAEHEIVFLPRLRRNPFGSLAGVVSAERLNRSARYRRRC